MRLRCGHTAAKGRSRLCAHLLAAVPAGGNLPWYRLLSGTGLEADLACHDCAFLPAGDRTLVACCEDCLGVFENDGGYFVRLLGEPGIEERPEPLPTSTQRVSLPDELSGPIDLQPLQFASTSAWLLLTASGDLVRFDLDDGTIARVASAAEALVPEPIPEPNFPNEVRDHREWREWETTTRAPRALHVSGNGRFAAVVAVHGSRGVVFDLARGAPTMRLDRGDHHVWACRFPCAFVELDGRTLLVHGTDWNRLDLSDPSTGELLTGRGPTRWKGEEQPAHYLDYSHGARPLAVWRLDRRRRVGLAPIRRSPELELGSLAQGERLGVGGRADAAASLLPRLLLGQAAVLGRR